MIKGEEIFGSDQKKKIRAKVLYTTILLGQQRFEEVEKYCKDVLEMNEEVVGPTHPQIIKLGFY